MEEKKIIELSVKELKKLIHEVVSEELAKRGYMNPPVYYQPYYSPCYQPCCPPQKIICTDHTIVKKEEFYN